MANRELTPWRTPSMQTFGRDPFATFRREMDRLFDDFFAPAEARSFSPAAQGQAQAQGMIMPSVDVHETDQAYTVTAELPGIDQKDIELSLDDNVLTLRGEKRSERHEEDGGRRYSERSFGRFERSIPFAAEVDADRVEATCENGLLKITLPKNANARDKSRRIEVKGARGASTTSAQVQGGAGQSAQGQGAQGQPLQGQAPPRSQADMGAGRRPTGDV